MNARWLLCMVVLVTACSSSPPSEAPTPSPTLGGVVERSGSGDTAGPSYVSTEVPVGKAAVVDGYDWSMPAWAKPQVNSGYFSEDSDPDERVLVRSADQSWRQLAPSPGAIETTGTGTAQDMFFDSLDDALAQPGPFWMRIFASGVDWAPEWVAKTCDVQSYGPDYDGQRHLPIWNECVWRALLVTYRQVFVDRGLAADPRLQFVYVPGAFTWAQYDYEMIASAVESGDLDFETYQAWYDHAWGDLVDVFGPYSDKLVFTGEDYPFGPFEIEQQGLLALEATKGRMGIRTGITELSNFHLSEAASYGSHIQPDGHLTIDEALPIHNGRFVIGTENECFNDCGFATDDPEYAVRQANLKALQLRVNWLYVVPGPSYVAEYPEHWDWVRLSLGRTVATSPDAWAQLRDAEDTFWSDPAPPFDSADAWRNRPWVRNLERWLVQRDVEGGTPKRATVDVRRHILERDNGVAYEGLSTDVEAGQRGIYLDLDDRFVSSTTGAVQVKVTYWDAGGPLQVQVGKRRVDVDPTGSPTWRTATVQVPIDSFDSSLTGDTDFGIEARSSRDVVVGFVRVVRLEAPVT